MVRPNHDLPNLLVGGVRDYAEREGLDDSDAHAALLENALKDAGILGCDSDDQPDTETDSG